MFTACRARLIATFSILRLELLLITQGSDSDFCTWALKLNKIIPSYPKIYSEMKGIIDRGISENSFLTSEIRGNAISSAIINYTSANEYYLGDLINLKLNDNRLLKRGLDLKDVSINRFDIVNYESLEEIRKKYILLLSSEFTRGELWTRKIANASKLFDIPFDKNLQTMKSIDSIWEHRNKIAHLNRRFHLPIELTDLDGKTVIFSEVSSNDKFVDFCLKLLTIMQDGMDYIEKFEKNIIDKWN